MAILRPYISADKSASKPVRTALSLVAGLVILGCWVGCAPKPAADSDDDEDDGTSQDQDSTNTTPTTPRPTFDAGAPRSPSSTEDAGNTEVIVPDAGTVVVDPVPVAYDPATCTDAVDARSFESLALALPATSDSQNGALTRTGVLAGLTDVDFY